MLQAQAIAPQGPSFSPLIAGYWRLMEWGMTPQHVVQFIEHHLALGITTVDHADIYGDYQCEAAFGAALRLAQGYERSCKSSPNAALQRARSLNTALVTTSPKPAIFCTAPKIRCAISIPITSICC